MNRRVLPLIIGSLLLPLGCGGNDNPGGNDGATGPSFSTLGVTTTTLPEGVENDAYSQTLTATGGDGSYSWALVSGSGLLPTGLSLAASGAITGMPTVVLTGNFTVQVTSGDGQTATQQLAITVGPCAITFADATLEAAIRTALDVGATFDLTCGLLSGLTELTVTAASIASLEGIQNLTGLTFLDLNNATNISDINPLSGLTSLTELNLRRNLITDISPLSGLTSLEHLNLAFNSITDINPLSEFTNLTWLNVAANSYSDVSALSGLTNLTFLAVSGSGFGPLPGDPLNGKVTDISALSGMTGLTGLWIGDHPITDISALSGMTSLERLYAFDNLITDISWLSGLTSLTFIDLSRNSNLANIQPLIDNTGLGSGDGVWLSDTSVSCSDVSALRAKGVGVRSNVC